MVSDTHAHKKSYEYMNKVMNLGIFYAKNHYTVCVKYA